MSGIVAIEMLSVLDVVVRAGARGAAAAGLVGLGTGETCGTEVRARDAVGADAFETARTAPRRMVPPAPTAQQ